MYGKKEEKNRVTEWIAVGLLFLVLAGFAGCGREASVILESLSDERAVEESEAFRKEKGSETAVNGAGSDTEALPENRERISAEGLPESGGETARETETMEKLFQVHVCGAVRIPGVYKLPAGSRVFEAVEAAGGLTEGAAGDYLNLADMVFDGAKVRVPFLSELPGDERYGDSGVFGVTGNRTAENLLTGDTAGEASGAPKNSGTDHLVDLNRADKETLMTLPGIGEAKAEAMISWREEHGPFGKPEDIMQVPGIKEAAYEKLKDKITVKD